jgi:hypothetical protein
MDKKEELARKTTFTFKHKGITKQFILLDGYTDIDYRFINFAYKGIINVIDNVKEAGLRILKDLMAKALAIIQIYLKKK